jgi:hypothetical protein
VVVSEEGRTRAEVADVAAGMRRILGAIETGDLVADPGLIARLEGAAVALDTLARSKDDSALHLNES